VERFSSKPWFPIGITTEFTQEENIGLFEHYNIHTTYGTLDMLNIENLEKIQTFNNLLNQISGLEEFELWGDLEDSETFDKIEINETNNGVKILLSNPKKSLEGVFHNIPTKSWRRKWSEIGNDSGFLIPTAGIQWKGFDVMVFRFKEETTSFEWKSESPATFSDMGKKLGEFHKIMLESSAPRMATEWNSRLKRLETITSSGTLWRVPYSKHTDSIRSLGNLTCDDWLMNDGTVCLDLLHLGYQELGKLITDTNRFSCLRDVASMYVDIDKLPSVSGSDSSKYLRRIFFESWCKTAPQKWYSKSALDGNLGGMQIWRYDVELMRFFLAKVSKKSYDKIWMKNVKDIQRDLFTYRIISGSALGMLLSSAMIALLWPGINIGLKIVILGMGVVIYFMGMRIYRKTSLPPY
jgi:hypothetical protein